MTNPKMKAHIKFCRFEGALAMQVLDMDERFRFVVTDDFLTQNDLKIHKFKNVVINSGLTPPAIYKYLTIQDGDIELCLPGAYKDTDRFIGKINQINTEILDDAINALIDWAKNYETWVDEEPITPIFKDALGNEYSRLEDVQGCVVEVMV